MATYYCDLSQDFADQTGADAAGNEYYGSGGFQAAIRGTGNATALVANDDLYVKGTAPMDRLVLFDIDTDVGAGGLNWAIGDAIWNDNDAGGAQGDDWQGRLCEVFVSGGGYDEILVQLDADYDQTDINAADGLWNNTQSDAVNIDSFNNVPIYFDTNPGTNTNHVRVTGVNGAWTEDGTRAIFDGEGNQTPAVHIWQFDNTTDAWWFTDIEIDEATSDGIDASTAISAANILVNIYIHNCTAQGLDGSAFSNSILVLCRFESNGSHGGHVDNNCALMLCQALNNTDVGFFSEVQVTFIGCVSHGNGTGFFALGERSFFSHCVADGNATRGFYFETVQGVVMACRTTNHSGAGDFGIETSAAGDWTVSLYNYFEDNNTNRDVGIRQIRVNGAVADDEDNADTNEGYTNIVTHDFNLRTDATHQNTAVELNA